MDLLTDLLVVFVLVLLNGFFSGSEIAVISLKRTRLSALIEQGDRRARAIKRLKSDPDRFFATVQIGVTLVGTLASVYGGARIIKRLEPWLSSIHIPLLNDYVSEIALAVLVVGISYMSLVFGELVPKSIALRYAERVALMVAFPLSWFGRLFRAFTILLTVSSNLILRLFKDHTSFSETRVQEEEIRQLLQEGVRAGTIESSEHEIISNVFEINDTSAREIMEPRVNVRAISLDARPEEFRRLVDCPFNRIPVYKGSMDHIVGILHLRDYLRMLTRHTESEGIQSLIRPAYFVPESMKIDKILEEMHKRRTQMAIVVDEYGVTAGLLTMEDILEEIVGDIQDDVGEEARDQRPIQATENGSYLVLGSCSIGDFNEQFGEDTIPEADSYNSVAGFVIEHSGRFPEVGERIVTRGFSFELVKRVRQQLVQFRVEPATLPVAPDGPEQ